MGLLDFIEGLIHNAQGILNFVGRIPALLMSLTEGLPLPLVSALAIILTVVIAFRIFSTIV